MGDDFADRHRDRLTWVKRRDLARRRPTAFVAAGSELLGKADAVLRHPRVRRDQDEVPVRQRGREHGRHADEERSAKSPPRSPYRLEAEYVTLSYHSGVVGEAAPLVKWESPEWSAARTEVAAGLTGSTAACATAPVERITQLTIVGVPGSPYSRKLRAVLRYRRIPHAWVLPGSPESRGLPEPRVALLPRLILPGDDGALEARVDSTPLIRVLEGSHRGRSVVPPDPAMAFLDALLEDYADEWLTKPMFHYRWAFAPDVARAAAIPPRWSRTNHPERQAVALRRPITPPPPSPRTCCAAVRRSG